MRVNILIPPFLMYLIAISLSLSISAMEIGLGLVLLFLIIYLWQNKINIIKDNSYIIPFLLFWFATLCSVIFGNQESDKIGGIFAIWGLLYFFSAYYLVSTSTIRLIFASLLLGGVILSISIFYDYFILNLPRPGGFLKMYLSSANILVIIAITSLSIIVTGYEKGKYALLYGISILLLIFAVILTGSRMSLLSFIATASLIFIFKFKVKGLIYSIILLILVSIISIFSDIGDRFAEILTGLTNIETSHGWRFVLWKAAFQLFKDYPIFGIGDGAFEPLVLQIVPKSIFATGHAHNGFIHLLVTYGIVGFITFCYFYGKITIDLLKNIYSNKYAFIGFFVIVSFFIESLTESVFFDGETKMITMFILGIVLGAIKKSISDNATENKVSFYKNN